MTWQQARRPQEQIWKNSVWCSTRRKRRASAMDLRTAGFTRTGAAAWARSRLRFSSTTQARLGEARQSQSNPWPFLLSIRGRPAAAIYRRKPLQQPTAQLGQGQRLGKLIVHPGRQARLTAADQGVGGQRDNRCGLTARSLDLPD